MPTIRISDPAFLDLLIQDLTARSDVVAQPIAPDAVKIGILGSYNREALRMATLLRIRAWEAAQRARGIDVFVDLE